MKSKFTIFSFACAGVFLGACVNVDKEVSETPSQFWKAPKDALPDSVIEPEQIKTETIDTKNQDSEKEESEKSKDTVRVASEKLKSGAVLDLSDIVDIALENNPSTRVYWFQSKIYAANVGKANSAYYPQVSLNAQVYRSKTKTSIPYFPGVGSYYETGFGPSAEINWLIYDFGKRETQVDYAKEALRAANFDYNQTIQDVVLGVNVAYYNFYSAMGKVKAAQMTVQDALTTYKSAKARLDEGVGRKQDMLNALASLRNAEFGFEQSKALVETSRADLAKAMGIRVSQNLKISDNVKIPVSLSTQEKIDNLIASAMRSRQDLLASYASLRGAALNVEIAKRDFLPSIGAFGQLSYTDYTQDNRNASEQYTAGLQLSWSIFEGFSRKYELISAKAAERAKAQELKASEIKIISDVWAYYHSYKSALKQVESARAAVAANTEAYKATKVGYDNGVNSLTDLLTSQNNLALARQQEVNSSADLSISIARLAHSTGALLSQTSGEIPTIKEKNQ